MLRLAVSALAVMLIHTAPAAQAPADFSGQWTAQAPPDSKPPRGDMGSGFGTPIAISQDAGQIVIQQTLFSRYDLQPPVRYAFALDGSESKNAVMIGHSTQVRTSRAAWDGAALRITTAYPAVDPGSGKAFTTEVTYRLSLESPSTLVIEATRAGVLGGKPTTTRTIYQKTPASP
jgi:hypothetical protein